jgi:Ca-activated chloride channel family protein
MGILAPLALAAIPLLAIIIALYLLKLRRPVAPIASLHLWGALTRDREANSLWQRLRVSALLILQLAVLILLILALARPWVHSTEPVGQNAIIVIDVSASMGATDVEPRSAKTRLDAAKERALSLVDALPQDGTGTLIASGEHAAVLVPATGDRARLRSAINNLALQASATDMLEAMKLAGVMAARQPNSAVWLLSDGAFPVVRGQVEPIPAQLHYISFGTSGANQAVTALTLQQSAGTLQLFAQVLNADTVTATRRLDLSVDDNPWTARSLTLAPGATQELVIEDVPLSARVVQAQLAGGVDRLAADDDAWVINRASTPGTVLLVTSSSKFLEVALSLLPTVNLYKVDPKEYTPSETVDGAPLDLTVFDAGVGADVLGKLPSGNILLFAPVTSTQLINVNGTIQEPVPQGAAPSEANQLGPGTDQTGRDPLLKYVDLSGLNIAQAKLLEIPRWGRAVLSSDRGPLIVAGEESGRKVAVVAFDIRDTDLALQTAFPLLMRNLVSYLLPDPTGGLPVSVSPGSPVGIDAVAPEVDKILVEDPLAKEWSYDVLTGTRRIAFAESGPPGVYYVSQYASEKLVAQEAFAVNLFSRDEGAIAPNPDPGLPEARPIVGAASDPNGGPQLFQRELWPAVALIGFALLLIEWLYAQRMAVRRAITEWQTRRALTRPNRT